MVKSSPATVVAIILCPDGSPYEGRRMTLEVMAQDGYPFTPPTARFKERVRSEEITRWLEMRRPMSQSMLQLYYDAV